MVGFIAGLVLGLAIAVAVALFITNAPVPFVNKVRPASENVNPAGTGPLPDPNKPLYSQAPAKAAAPEPAEDRSGDRSEGRSATGRERAMSSLPKTRASCCRRAPSGHRDDADSMRARLALLGFDARVFPREQDGTTLYRVRLGPYGNLEDVNRIRKTMAENGIDVQLVRLK